MSHFALIVVTPEKPTDESLGAALQPFHEFECTGDDDQYVVDVDQTEEVRKEFETETTRRLRDAAGNLHEPWDDRFYRDPTPEEAAKIGPLSGTGGGHGMSWTSKDWGDGRGYRPKIQFVPRGWTEVEVLRKDIETFAAFVEDYHGKKTVAHNESPILETEHKYGYALLDAAGEVVKVIDRTNPNKRWDGWRVGGRYAGRLWPKRGAIERGPTAWEWKHEQERGRERPGGADICRMRNLDRERMKATAVEQRRDTLKEICERGKLLHQQLDEAMAQYRASQDVWQAMDEPRPRGGAYHEWLESNGWTLASKLMHGSAFDAPEVKVGQTVEEWCLAAPWLSAFAFLRNGQWHERGEMGWWAVVHNEKEDWPTMLQKLLADVPDDHWLTMVDCHI